MGMGNPAIRPYIEILIVLVKTRLNIYELKKVEKCFRPTQGLSRIPPYLIEKSRKAICAPYMGKYRNIKTQASGTKRIR
jgi:hypothetical protein